MNKKGFTLVELIAVIVILGIVLTITAVTITQVRTKTMETQYTNLKTTIKTAAQAYHEETGVSKVPVLILLQNGKLEADEIAKSVKDYPKFTVNAGDPVIYDPRDKDLTLNCDYIDFTDSEKGKYISANENPSKPEENGCSTTIIGENSVVVKVVYNGVEKPIVDGKYYGVTDGKTLAYKGSVEDPSVEYLWTSDASPDVTVTGQTLTIDLNGESKIEEEYTLTARIGAEEYTKTFMVLVDGRAPSISDAYVDEIDAWKQEKNIVGNIYDEESGIKGYYFVGEGENCDKPDYTKTQDEIDAALSKYKPFLSGKVTTKAVTKAIKKNGTHYICIVDNADNVTKAEKSITASKIDTAKPEMALEVSPDPKTDYKKSRTVKVTVTDKGTDNANIAGFDNETMSLAYKWTNGTDNITGTVYLDKVADNKLEGTFTLTGGTGDGTVSFTNPSNNLKDRAGNPLSDFKTTTVKLDNTGPTIDTVTVSSTKTGYNSATVNVTVSGVSDELNGISEMCVTKTNDASTCSWVSTTEASHTFTSLNAGTDGTGTTATFYAFAKDSEGNVSASESGSYTIYTYCTDKTISGYGTWSECSKACDTGTQTRDINYVDTHFNSHPCPTDEDGDSQSCNTRVCCDASHITYKDGNSCTKKCGGGTKNRVAYSTYDENVRCTDYDKTSGGSECNKTSCCDDSFITYKDGSSCSSVCGAGTKNRLAYGGDGSRCSSKDESSGGAACDSGSCCAAKYITYKDGSSCSASCGAGTYNQKAYGYDGARCSSYDKTSGGGYCNNGDCCSESSPTGCDVVHVWKGTTYIYTQKYGTGGYAGTVTPDVTLHLIYLDGNSAYVYSEKNYHPTNKYTPDPAHYGHIYYGCIDIYHNANSSLPCKG